MAATCPKCGRVGMVFEQANVPRAGALGTGHGVLILRCNNGGCFAAVSAMPNLGPDIDRLAAQVRDVSAKLDRIAHALQSRGF